MTETMAAVAVPAAGDKKVQVEKLLTDIFKLMQCPATLDFQDAPDGALGVAVHFKGEPPQGVAAGKKSHLFDSLQFLINKAVNRPNTERRWVNLGVGAFPEPRNSRPPQAAEAAPAPAQPRTPAAAVAAVARPPKAAPAARNAPPPRSSAPKHREPDEATLEVAADPAINALGKLLAQKSAKHGRYYAVTLMSADDRARLLQGAKGVGEVTVRTEGEAHLRRVAFSPAKPVAMPKKTAMPVYPDDED